jgi:PTS system nitrogen regulatory IIA component
MGILSSLHPRLVAFLDVETRDEAIKALIDKLDQFHKLKDKKAFQAAIFAREELVSTGIGMGVAVPHAKSKEFSKFHIVVGIQKKKGLDWKALDTTSVHIIFLIGGPEDQQSQYLKILSELTSAIRGGEFRKSLLKAENSQEVLDLFSQF